MGVSVNHQSTMRTKKPITLEILSSGQPRFTLPAGTSCEPARNIGKPGCYWVRDSRNLPPAARNLIGTIGVLLTPADLA